MSLLLEKIRREELANRGKSEETLVKNLLDTLKSTLPYFDFARRPDARACMGRIGPQPSDFECLIKGKQFEIEVKSTKAKNTIPYKNFSQLGMLRRRDMCGANVIILIYRAKHGVWCRPDFSVMLETYDPENKASWNIDGCTSYLRVAEILTEALGLGHLLKQE